MTPSTAYRDGWLAQKYARISGEGTIMVNPYDVWSQHYSHMQWNSGLRDRAAKLPGGPYLEILDADAMRVDGS